MTINEYQNKAMRTKSCTPFVILNNKDEIHKAELLEGVMGLNGEAGECVDILKKHIFQGHEINREHLASELGDVAWYLALSAYAIGYDLDSIFQLNIKKLKKRYPNGFESEKSLNRDKNDI